MDKQVEFPTIPDKNDTSELMLIVSEYVESIKTPPLIVRCSGIGGTISPLGNKKVCLKFNYWCNQVSCFYQRPRS